MGESREKNRFNLFFLESPAPFAGLKEDSWLVEIPRAQVGGQNGDAVTSPRQAARDGADFEHSAAAFLKRKVGLDRF